MEKIKSSQRRPEAFLRAFKPSLGRAEADSLFEAVESGWLGTGIFTKLFETRLASELGARRALATNSGTAALHLALRSLDVEGGEVITTPVTSVATNHAILYNGAVPVFCDVELETGNIDPAKVEALVGPRTKAIVAVHLGHACEMDALAEIAKRRRVFLVEDACACHAIGGFFKDRPLGAIGDTGCFSFGRFKGITTLDGGAVVAKSEARLDRLVRLRRLGLREEDGRIAESPEGVAELGFHYRMNDLSAALGLAQLKRRAAIQSRLDEVLRRYRDGLAELSFLRWPTSKAYSRGVRAYAAVAVLGGRRDALRRFMLERGVELNDVLYPNHFYKLYARHRRKLPVAEAYCAETLHLPFYPDLSDRDVDRIIETIRAFKG